MRLSAPLTFTLLMLWTGVQSMAAEITHEKRSIYGRVVDSEKVALAGAVIELWPWVGAFENDVRFTDGVEADRPLATGRSDNTGHFELTATEGDSFRLEVRAQGHLPMATSLVHLMADVDLPTLELTPASDLDLRVQGVGDALLDQAWFKLVSRDRPRGDWRPVAGLRRVGEDGKISLEIPTSKTYLVSAFAPGHVPVRRDSRDSSGTKIELEKGVARAIRVVDAAWQPAVGALVRVGKDAWPAGRCDENGRFVVYPPVDGELQVTVEAADGSWGTRRIDAPEAGENKPLRIELERPTTMAGRVTDALTTEPLAGARVWLTSAPGHFTHTDRDGQYELSFPAFRQFPRLQAAAVGYRWEVGTLRGGPMGHRKNIALHPVAPLHGRVFDVHGEVIEGAEISFRSQQAYLAANLTRSRRDGSFRVLAARDLLYQLDVTKSGYLTESLEITGRGDRVLDVVLERGLQGFGFVVDDDRRPIPGAEVRLGKSATTTSAADFPYQATSEKDGRFDLENLAQGTFDLWAKAPGFGRTLKRGVTIDENRGPVDSGIVDFGTLVLEPGARITGQVVDSEGNPLADASVRWIASASGFPGGSYGSSHLPGTTSDAAGHFVLDDLPSGEKVSLQARLTGYSWAQMKGVETSGEPVVLVLSAKGTVRGIVVDNLGEPIPEAMVSCSYDRGGGGGHGSGRQSDRDGRFEFEVDATRTLKLSAESPDLKSTTRWIEVAPGQVVEDLKLILEPGAVIDGRVLGPDGDPIAGAGISAWGKSLFRGPNLVTDEEGRFRVAGLETGTTGIQVSAEGFPEVARQLEVKSGINPVEIRLQETHEVHGRVVDEALQPVGGARVSLSGANGRGDAVSDVDGKWVLSVPDGRYRPRAWKQGFASARPDEEIEVSGAPVAGIELQLTIGGAIVGRILGLEPDRLADIWLRTQPASRAGTVERDGRYRIENLAPGEWRVAAIERSTGRSTQGKVELQAGVHETVLDLEFFDGLTLSGRVTVDDEPSPGATIELHGLDPPSATTHRIHGALERLASTDYSGLFSVSDLEPGRYLLVALQDGVIQRRELDLVNDHEVEIDMRTHGLDGRVVDATTGEPLQGAIVKLEPTSGEILPAIRTPHSKTDSQGVFRFARIAENDYQLTVTLTGYATLKQPIDVRSRIELEDLVLRLEPTEGLTLKVQHATGGRLHRVGVAAYSADGDLVLNSEFTVTEGGIARLSTLPPGRWHLLVAARNSGNVQLSVTTPADPVQVLLPPGTQLEVRVPELEASRHPATLRITGTDGRPFLAMYSHSPLPANEWPVLEGQAMVRGFPPGLWNLVVTTAEGQSWQTTFVAPATDGNSRVSIE